MKRLRHSAKGLVRSMQMSRAAVNVFIEGEQVDGYFYSKIVYSESPAPFAYRVIRSNQLPTPGSGKKHLLIYFRLLRRQKQLVIDFKGKRSVVLFFLDKDIDDLSRTMVRSPHVIYTQYYEVENYLYMHGDLIEVSAAAFSADIAEVMRHFGSVSDWTLRAADRWKDWVKLCLAASDCRARGVCNYHSASQVHSAGVLDPTLFSAKLAEIELASGLSHADFVSKFRRLQAKVNRYYASGDQDRLFKGKWYSIVLSDELAKAGLVTGAASKSMPSKLVSGLMQSLDFSEDWTSYF